MAVRTGPTASNERRLAPLGHFLLISGLRPTSLEPGKGDEVPMRFLPLLALAVISSPPASAVTFDFDDFPEESPSGSNGYTCLPVCGVGGGTYLDQLTVTREGLTLTIEKDFFEIWGAGPPEYNIIDGGDPSSFDLFHLAFSTPVATLTLDALGPHQDDIYDDQGGGPIEEDATLWLRAYLYDGDGVLLEDFLLTEPSGSGSYLDSFTFTHPEGIAELYIGNVRATDPDCIQGCTEATVYNGGFAFDDVIATPIPEPATALLVAVGLGALATQSRTRRQP